MMTYASCCAISMCRRGLGWFRLRGRCRNGFPTKYLKHHGAARRAFSLNSLAPVFHRFFDTIDNFLLGLAFDTVSFRHRKRWPPRRFMRRGSYENSLEAGHCQRQQRKDPSSGRAARPTKWLIIAHLDYQCLLSARRFSARKCETQIAPLMSD